MAARHAKLFFVPGLICLMLLAGCAFPHYRHVTHHITRPAKGQKPDTQQLLAALQKNFRTVSSFHVLMQVQNAGPAQGAEVQIRNANGDVVMPDKVKAQASVTLSGQNVDVNLVSIGNTQAITDPLTGQWRVIKGVLDPRTLTNPDTGIISLLGKMQHVSQPVADSVNNAPCWRISGQLDAKYLAFLTGSGVPAGTMLQTSACIGQSDALLYTISVVGRAAPSDTPQTTRTFDLSNYNENVAITMPQL
ncbi:MAG: lipoarabinomannan carrier protein LprG [Ktedonobacteraceae bacterium]